MPQTQRSTRSQPLFGVTLNPWVILGAVLALIAGAWYMYDLGGDRREDAIYAEQAKEKAALDAEAKKQREADQLRDAALAKETADLRKRLAHILANPPKPETLVEVREVPVNAGQTTCPAPRLSSDFLLHYNAAAELHTGTNPAD